MGFTGFDVDELLKEARFNGVIVNSHTGRERKYGTDTDEEIWRFSIYNRSTDRYVPVKIRNEFASERAYTSSAKREFLSQMKALGVAARTAEGFDGWEMSWEPVAKEVRGQVYITYKPTAKVQKVSGEELLTLDLERIRRGDEAKAKRAVEGGETTPHVNKATTDYHVAIPYLLDHTEEEVLDEWASLPGEVQEALRGGAMEAAIAAGALAIDLETGRFTSVGGIEES